MLIQALILLASVYWGSGAQAAAPSKPPVPAEPTQALDPVTALRVKRILIFPALDDVGGAIAAKLDERVVELFNGEGRFDVIKDPQVIKTLHLDLTTYPMVAANASVHKSAARVTGADTTVLLRNKSIANLTEMTLELRDVEGDVLFTETGSLPNYSPMESRYATLDRLFAGIIKQIPFQGTITGKRMTSLTFDMGMAKVKQGDEIFVSRFVSVQRHPLLRNVVGSDFVRVGKAKVVSTDRSISFAEVVEEYPGEQINVGSKITEVRHHELKPKNKFDEPFEEKAMGESALKTQTQNQKSATKTKEEPEILKGDFDREKPHYGYVGMDLFYGSISATGITGGNSTAFGGSGLGGGISGEMWITRNWIFRPSYMFQSSSLSDQSEGSTSTTVRDGSWKKFSGLAGYRFFLEVNDASLTGLLGYQTESYHVSTLASSSINTTDYSGLAFGVEGQMTPIPLNRVSLGFVLEPLATVSQESNALGTPDSGTVISVKFSWAYQFSDGLWARMAFKLDSASATFSGSNTSSNKHLSVGPGLEYWF